MLSMLRRACAVTLLIVVAWTLASGPARAAMERPNALDRNVDAIARSALMGLPATRLTDRPRQAAADRLADATIPGWVAAALLQALALAYFWGSGAAAVWRDRLRRRLRSEGWARFAFGASLGGLARLAALPAAFYLYRIDRVMGLTPLLTRTWGGFWILHSLSAAIVAGIIAAYVLWLVDRTHQWYLYTIVTILAVTIGWSNAAPYFAFSSSGLVPVRGAAATAVRTALTRAGYPDVPVYVQSGQDAPLAGAVVQGLGAARRVVVPAALARSATPAELEYDVAVQLASVVHRDALLIALIEAAIIIVGAALAVAIADRVHFRRDDDPLSRLALVGALLAIAYLVGVPVRNAAQRHFAMRDDAYAVALTAHPAAAVRAIVRATDQRMDEDCPDVFALLFVDTRPAPSARIAAINGVPTGCP